METQTPNQIPDQTTIQISLPTHAYFISGLRDFTLNLIKNLTNFSEQWAFRFQSIVDELCNNAIEYGSTPGANILITFNVIRNESVEIQVKDTGNPNHQINAEQLTKLIKERREPGYVNKGIRGRGLTKIVSEWTDELTFTDNENHQGLTVTIKKNLHDPKLSVNNPFEKQNLIIIN